jgi:acetylornithine deacetylase/succinyl-diaminopimelate desuccinylase-like protein
VIPALAKARVDGRIVPGETVDSFLGQIKERVGSRVRITVEQSQEPHTVDWNHKFYHHLANILEEAHPGSYAVPYCIPGFSDSGNYIKLGINTYGFAPVQLPKGLDFASLFHAPDERIPLEGLFFGTRALRRAVEERPL